MEADEACFEEPEESDALLFVAGKGTDALGTTLKDVDEAFEGSIGKERLNLGSDGRNEKGVGTAFNEVVGLEELGGVMSEEFGKGEADGG